MESERSAYLVILGEAKGLAYVMREQRLAFPTHPPRGGSPRAGDRLFFYVTRGVWGTRVQDRGRLVASGTAVTSPRLLDEPFALAGRRFRSGLTIAFSGMAPLGEGLELVPILPALSAFPNPATYTSKLRRPLLLLPGGDAERIDERLQPLLRDPAEVAAAYVEESEAFVRRREARALKAR